MNDLQARLQSVLGNTYQIEKELGGGGMSRVFLAEERELGRQVVIKVLPPEMAAGVNAERFRREIKLAASLQHPHIVPLLTAGSAGDLLYYVMPFVAGESLRAKLAREGELPIADTVRILSDVADALAYAHANGVVHRDIKPDNVLVSGHHAVVTDFGVAKAVSDATGAASMTSVGVALGTPAYMAPEQAAADPHTDHRADLYALGAVAYELLAGRPPFTGASPQMVLASHVTEAPVPVTQQRPNVPAPLAELVMRCLAKKPADRWQTAQELLRHLETMATPSGGMTPTGSVPVQRPAPGWAMQAWRSRRGLAIAAGAVLLVAAGYFGAARLGGRGGSGGRGEKRLAVLPFQNLGAPDDQYFADGITEEITERLARVAGLAVISRTSTLQYKTSTKSIREIGTELGVAYVLEGSIRWQHAPGATSEVRVTPQLIRVVDDTHLWADAYSADLTKVFQVQEEIAGKVAEALNVALLGSAPAGEPERPTSNLEAYDYYLRGNAFLLRATNGGDYRQATDPYQHAVQLDPNFALAWARLSRAHSGTYWFYADRSDARLALAKAAADRALTLAPDLADAHIALGYYYYWGSLDYPHALEQFAMAQRSEPNNSQLLEAVAYVERREGHWDDAATHLARAVELDPRAYVAVRGLAQTYFALRRFPEAERVADRAIPLRPDVVEAYQTKAFAALGAGDTADARRTLRDAEQTLGAGKVALELANQPAPDFLFPFLGDDTRGALAQLRLTAEVTDTASYYVTKSAFFGWLNQGPLGRLYAESAAAVLEKEVQRRPDDEGFHTLLGLVYGRLGRAADAVREGRRAVELLPLARDAYAGGDMIGNLARIYAWQGQHDAAIEQLEHLVSIPSNVSPPLLRIDPDFAPLRQEPRFRKLVGSP